MKQAAQALAGPESKPYWETAHEEIAKRAQKAVLNSYAQRVTARETQASRSDMAYRARTTRFGNGKLRATLASPKMVTFDHQGFTFLNRRILDRGAEHWYRLNFGVGRRAAGSQQGLYSMRVNGGVVGAPIGFKRGDGWGGPSRHPLILPPGFWINSGGNRVAPGSNPAGRDAFFPVVRLQSGRAAARRGGSAVGRRVGSPGKPRMTQGIAARNYLDAGMKAIASETPLAYERMLRQVIARLNKVDIGVLEANMPKMPKVRVRVLRKPSSAPTLYRRGMPV